MSDDVREMHGVRVALPVAQGWEDHTVFRWAAPKGEEERGFRANAMMTHHARVPEEIPLDQVFSGPNVVAKQQSPDFQVLRGGVQPYLEQDCAWQDTCFFDRGAQRMIFQRQVALRPRPGALVVLTLTSDENNLDELSEGFRFAVSASDKSRSRAAAAAAKAAGKS